VHGREHLCSGGLRNGEKLGKMGKNYGEN